MPLQRRRRHLPLLTLFAVFLMSMGLLAAAAQAAPTDGLAIKVVSARTEARALNGAGVTAGDAVGTFRYIVNVDNTGSTHQRSPADGCSPASAGYPAGCKWTSIAGVPGSSPIATQGDQSDFAGGATLALDPGRYLISVMADGFKLDGAHFSVNADRTVDGPVTVELQPTPLPDSTVRALVFHDNSPVNGAPDAPVEPGLAGFEGQLADYLGQVTTDVYGNPLCTVYRGEDPVTHEIPTAALDANGLPVVATPGGHCYSDARGMLAIPHMGTNRYALSVVPPNGEKWIQTTTLEGNHDWDSWVMEGNTGYDTEFVIAGEPVPTAIFGFVKPTSLPNGGATGEIKGVVDAVKVYVPAAGGLTNTGQIWGGLNGGKIDKPIEKPWLALSGLQVGDTAVYVGQGNADGSFDITNVPDGNYTLTWWDEPQNHILDLQNVTVANGEVVDLGVLPLTGWWTRFEGHVFNDLNGNGKRDAGEPGIKNFPIVMKKRENSGMDRGNIGTTTAADGSYVMENTYPMTQWLVMEAYSDRYRTTGITYQSDNQPDETTVPGTGVDVSVLPIIGLSGRVDWGVQPYAPGTNGGIVGTVSYDTTRNELDPRFAAVEPWQPGVPGITVSLYQPIPCGTNPGTPCDSAGGNSYEVTAMGAFALGPLVNQATTEHWQRPGTNADGTCVPRDVEGSPLGYLAGQLVTNSPADCLEGPLMGVQFQAGFSTVDGNYGFGDACFGPGGFDPSANGGGGGCADGTAPTPLGVGDYLVKLGIPHDAFGKPLYKLTREEDINIGNGDRLTPQVPPPACAGALHTVDVAGVGTDNYAPVTDANGIRGVTVPASTPTVNATFVDLGGSIYEGKQRPLCDAKIVHVSNQRSIAPTFNLFTDVPVPGRFWGLIVDDLNFSTDKKSLLYGEKAGVPFAPVGIYDYTNRLVRTVESDFNGLFDVLLPSTNRINCPTPSGVCANLYRLVGNDPGVPGRLNANYKPEFRTIAAEFESIPGLIVPADLAPTQVGVSVQLPGGQTNQVKCPLGPTTPQLFSVSKPYVDMRVPDDRTFVIRGQGFGPSGTVHLGEAVLPTDSWSDTQISVHVPDATTAGAQQLDVVSESGRRTVNGLTFHVLGGTYTPHVYEVGPGRTFAPANSLPQTADHAVQRAIDAAAASPGNDLVVVYPGLVDTTNPRANPRGAYYENLIISQRVRLQGVGPGGIQSATGTTVPGSIIDGGAFSGDGPVAADWYRHIAGLTWDGNQNVNDGAVISLYAQNGAFPIGAAFTPMIDGLDLRGGNQTGFPNNINRIGGGPTGRPGAVVTQGGAIFANAYVRGLQVTNNVVQNNGGGYGTIRIGTPDLPGRVEPPDGGDDLPAPDPSNNHNEEVRIAKNRIIQNAGTNLAGGIGIFAGADGYDVAQNDICGNFSAEYGGGLTVYGLSPNGKIRDNRIYFNRSYDEGGGVMIAGALPNNPAVLSAGTGTTSITANLIQANLANDDGGGLRFLMAGRRPMNVANNVVVNNVSTHEGGGIALNDTTDVRIVNNTIMKNMTTATALTSDGLAAPAGISTSANSAMMQAALPAGSPVFSNPILFNNILWDNRAGTRAGATVTGLGVAGDASPINHWDAGAADGSGLLAPTNSVLQTTTGTVASPTNRLTDPGVVSSYDSSVDFAAWRTNPNFVGAILVALDLPPDLMGNHHLADVSSPAFNLGAGSKTGVTAPTVDIDGEARPGRGGFDAGADEIPGPAPAPVVPAAAGRGAAIANLGIARTDGVTRAQLGTTLRYSIQVTNTGPAAAGGARVSAPVPPRLTAVTWVCSARGGASCGRASGTGAIDTTGDLPAGGTMTFIVKGRVAATGRLVTTARVHAPEGVTDPDMNNNTASDIDSVPLPATRKPRVRNLDSFNRSNQAGLGRCWRQSARAIGIGGRAALARTSGRAMWDRGNARFGADQAASLTLAGHPVRSARVPVGLILKADGGTGTRPARYILASYAGGAVTVATTIDAGSTFTARARFSSRLGRGDSLTAVAKADGTVEIFVNDRLVGVVKLPLKGTGAWAAGGGGRIGMQLPRGTKVDYFAGGTVTP